METLSDLRKMTFKTMKDFADTLDVSVSLAYSWLNGSKHLKFSQNDIQFLANIFGVSFERCEQAANATFLLGYGIHNDLHTQWKPGVKRPDVIFHRFYEAHKGGDNTNIFDDPVPQPYVLQPFGLKHGATRADVMRAFRKKLKASHVNGFFHGDMHALVLERDKALQYVESK